MSMLHHRSRVSPRLVRNEPQVACHKRKSLNWSNP